jgi:hypothetical protein
MEGAGGMKLQLMLHGLWASVESKTTVVLIYVFHILQSINDISDYHTFYGPHFKLNRKAVMSFAGIKYVTV